MAIDYLIVIGASAGGIDTLELLVSQLPADINAAICVVVHLSPESPGIIHRTLGRAGALPAEPAIDGAVLETGHIYMARADHHLLVEPGRLRLSPGPKENRFRPAIDPLFRSSAQVYGPRVIGVVLSGNLDDGTAGLWAIKQLGGMAVVQNPVEARFPSMPQHALANVPVDYCVPVAEMGPLLVRLTSMSVHERPLSTGGAADIEVRIASGANAREAGVQTLRPPSPFACPECHGTLLQLTEGNRRRFRCHTGHARSLSTVIAAANEAIEQSLWSTIRAIDEAGRMMTHMAEYHTRDDDTSAAEVSRVAEQAFKDADILRNMAERRGRRGDIEKAG